MSRGINRYSSPFNKKDSEITSKSSPEAEKKFYDSFSQLSMKKHLNEDINKADKIIHKTSIQIEISIDYALKGFTLSERASFLKERTKMITSKSNITDPDE